MCNFSPGLFFLISVFNTQLGELCTPRRRQLLHALLVGLCSVWELQLLVSHRYAATTCEIRLLTWCLWASMARQPSERKSNPALPLHLLLLSVLQAGVSLGALKARVGLKALLIYVIFLMVLLILCLVAFFNLDYMQLLLHPAAPQSLPGRGWLMVSRAGSEKKNAFII